jgi:tyrosyl-tRNA synthetase
MDAEKILNTLIKGCSDIVSKEELKKKISSAETLTVKLGCDPTSCDLHLGHSVVLFKMRQFQDMGHTGVLVIGDFTASIGDPSGRDSTRPVLSAEQIKQNAQTYTTQALKILDPARTVITFNSQWLNSFVGTSSAGETLKPECANKTR